MSPETASTGPAAADPMAAVVQRLRAPLTSGNWIRDLHPGTVGVVLLAMVVVAVSRPGLLWPAGTCLAYIVIASFAGVGREYLVTFLRVALFAGLILFVARSTVLPGEQVLFQFGGLKVSVESIQEAGRFALVVLAICGAVILLFILQPMRKILLSFEEAGVSPKVTFVVLSSIQLITNLGKHSTAVREAQESRGIEMGGSLAKRIKAFLAIIPPVFLAGLNQVEERALALEARAFYSPAKHTRLTVLARRAPYEIVIMLVALTAAVASLTGAFTQWF